MLTQDELLNITIFLRDLVIERIQVMQKNCKEYGNLLDRNIKLLKQLDETVEKLRNKE